MTQYDPERRAVFPNRPEDVDNVLTPKFIPSDGFQRLNERQADDDVLIQNPYLQESYWVPNGAAAEAARLAAMPPNDFVLTQEHVNAMTPFDLGAYWLSNGGSLHSNNLYFDPNSEMSRQFSQGIAAKKFEAYFFKKFNGRPQKGDVVNNYDDTAGVLEWDSYSDAVTFKTWAVFLAGSVEDGFALAGDTNVLFRINNIIGTDSLFAGRVLEDYGLGWMTVGKTRNDVHIIIEWKSPLILNSQE